MDTAVLADHLRRLVDRLRSMPLTRLGASTGDEGSRADRAHGLAQLLADSAAALEPEPHWREVPRLADSAVGDQVAVTAQDLLAGLHGLAGERPVGLRDGTATTVLGLVDRAEAACRDLRAAL